MNEQLKPRLEINDDWFADDRVEDKAGQLPKESWREFRGLAGWFGKLIEGFLAFFAPPGWARWWMLLGALLLAPVVIDVSQQFFAMSSHRYRIPTRDLVLWTFWLGLLTYTCGGIVLGRIGGRERLILAIAVAISLLLPLVYQTSAAIGYEPPDDFWKKWWVIATMSGTTLVGCFGVYLFLRFCRRKFEWAGWAFSEKVWLVVSFLGIGIGTLVIIYPFDNHYFSFASWFRSWPQSKLSIFAALVGIVSLACLVVAQRTPVRAILATCSAAGWALLVAVLCLYGSSFHGVQFFVLGTCGFWLGLSIAGMGCFRNGQSESVETRFSTLKGAVWLTPFWFGLVGLLIVNHFFSVRYLVDYKLSWQWNLSREIQKLSRCANGDYLPSRFITLFMREGVPQKQCVLSTDLNVQNVNLHGLDSEFDLISFTEPLKSLRSLAISDSVLVGEQLSGLAVDRLHLTNVTMRPTASLNSPISVSRISLSNMPTGSASEVLTHVDPTSIIDIYLENCRLDADDWRRLCALAETASVVVWPNDFGEALKDPEVVAGFQGLSPANFLNLLFENTEYSAVSGPIIAELAGSHLKVHFYEEPDANADNQPTALNFLKENPELFWDLFFSMRRGVEFPRQYLPVDFKVTIDREYAIKHHLMYYQDEDSSVLALDWREWFSQISEELAGELEVLCLNGEWQFPERGSPVSPYVNVPFFVNTHFMPFVKFPKLKELYLPDLLGSISAEQVARIKAQNSISEDIGGQFGILALCPNLEVLSLRIPNAGFDTKGLAGRLSVLQNLRTLFLYGDPTKLDLNALLANTNIEELVLVDEQDVFVDERDKRLQTAKLKELISKGLQLRIVDPDDPSLVPEHYQQHRERVFELLREKYREKLKTSGTEGE
jgi:hypothetical protein